MATDRLTRFSDAVLSEAMAKKQIAAEAAENEKNETLKEEAQQLAKWAEKRLQATNLRLASEKALFVSGVKNEQKAVLLNRRRQMFDEIFTEAGNKAREFVQSPNYAAFVRQKFSEAAELLGGTRLECTVNKQDMELFRGLNLLETTNGASRLLDVEFIPSPRDIIGGFLLKNPQSGVIADCSLTGKIEEQKELFMEKNAHMLEIL